MGESAKSEQRWGALNGTVHVGGWALLLLEIAALLIVLVAVVPRFAGIFRDFEMDLPATTKMVLAVSAFARQYWPLTVLGVCAVGGLLVVPYACLPRRRSELLLAYVVLGSLFTACALWFAVEGLFLPLIVLMNKVNSTAASSASEGAPDSVYREDGPNVTEAEEVMTEPKSGERKVKYIAFCCDLESPYTQAVKFPPSKGVFGRDMVKILSRYPGVPYTWMVLRDRDALVINYYAAEIYPLRKGVDETALHIHYKYYIQKNPQDFETFKDPAERRKWTLEALAQYRRLGLPTPETFRYGGGDGREEGVDYRADLELLYDAVGIRNYLISADVVRSANFPTCVDLGQGRWRVDGDRPITLISTNVSLDREEAEMYRVLEERLSAADYALITCHDYMPMVPGNLAKMIPYIREKHPEAQFVTISRIGDLIREGKLANPGR